MIDTKPTVTRTDDDWVKDLITLKEHADRGRFAAWQRWNESWRLYNNQFDFSKKAPWQARNFVPRVGMTVEMAASLVRRAMIDASEWFRYEGTTFASKEMAPYLEKLAYWYLDILRFVDSFVPPLKGGMVGSLIALKMHLAPYSVAPELMDGPAITISYPDPYNIWLDPKGRGLFIIENEDMDLATAFDLVDVGVLDGDVIAKVQEDWTDLDTETREDRRKQQLTDGGKPDKRPQVRLTHFWGSMPQRAGKWAIKNGHFVIVNEKYMGRKPMENPYDHKKLPYVIGSPFRRPFSVYHKGLIEDVVGLAKSMTELLNLSLDSTLFSGIKAFDVDLDQIEDPQQILNGIYPGKVFTSRKNGQDMPMIRDLKIESVAQDTLAVYQMLGTEYQNSTAVTEFISGALSSAPGRTATEVVTKQQQGMGIFGEMARNLEHSVLEPMLEQLAGLIVQYHDDFTSDKVIDILGEELAMELIITDAATRKQKFEPDRLRVRASGLSSMLNKTEEIQKINTLLQTLGQFGPEVSIVMGDIDQAYFFQNLFKRLVRAYGWNERDLIRPKTAEQKAAEAAAAGGAGAGTGAAATPPGAAPQPGQPAPPVATSPLAQAAQIRSAVTGGGMPPNGMVAGG